METMEKKEKWHAELNTSATRYCFVQGPPTFLSDFQVRHSLGELEWRRALAVSQILSCRFPLKMLWRLHLRDMCLNVFDVWWPKDFHLHLCTHALASMHMMFESLGHGLQRLMDQRKFLRLPSLYLLPPGLACWPHWRHVTRRAKMRATRFWDGCQERVYGSKISLMWIWEPKNCW